MTIVSSSNSDSQRMLRKYKRLVERQLQRDRKSLFEALEEFANMRPDKEGWAHFRKRWPNFFPESEYDRLETDSKKTIFSYPYWLNQIWLGGEADPSLHILLGIDPNPRRDQGTPEESWVSDLISIQPRTFIADWDDGTFHYEGGCDFQRATFLLFQESWRARVCERCSTKFIARRSAQKYCSKECVGEMQKELKRKWWADHGEGWRQERIKSKIKTKGDKNVTYKTR